MMMDPRRRRTLLLAALLLIPLPLAAAPGGGMSGFHAFGHGFADPPGRGGLNGMSGDVASARDAATTRGQGRALWRAHRDRLDLDPDGHLMVRDEILAIEPSPAALDAARARGFEVRRPVTLDALGISGVVLATPAGRSARRALKDLRAADPAGTYDFNHVYFESGSASPGPAPPAAAPPAAAAGVVRIGLIDGGVAADHPALRGITIHAHGCDGAPHPSAHGTAVASLLSGDAGRPDVARRELDVADVYCDGTTGGSVDLVGEAIAWLVAQQVPVINVSLVGPANALLERAVRAATARGILVVAAVGNDGPAAAPLYPAAYPGVVAVTAVDRHERVLVEAGRGPYVHFAAPGAGIRAAHLPDGAADVRGTSFAAPYVALRLAQRLARPDRAGAATALHELEAEALDLGAPGFDPVYGYGCLGCEPTPSQP